MARGFGFQLFVSRLSFYTTDEALKRLFSRFGKVTEAKLVKDPRTQRPKGFGFVTFESETDAQNARKAMNGRKLQRLQDLKKHHPKTKFIFLTSEDLYKGFAGLYLRTETKVVELLTVSQTSLLMFPQVCLQNSCSRQQSVACSKASQFATSTMRVSTTRRLFSPPMYSQQNQLSSWEVRAGVASDTIVPTTFMVNSDGETDDILPDSGGTGDNFGAAERNGGGGGNNGGNGDKNEGKGVPDENNGHNRGNSKNWAPGIDTGLCCSFWRGWSCILFV